MDHLRRENLKALALSMGIILSDVEIDQLDALCAKARNAGGGNQSPERLLNLWGMFQKT